MKIAFLPPKAVAKWMILQYFIPESESSLFLLCRNIIFFATKAEHCSFVKGRCALSVVAPLPWKNDTVLYREEDVSQIVSADMEN